MSNTPKNHFFTLCITFTFLLNFHNISQAEKPTSGSPTTPPTQTIPQMSLLRLQTIVDYLARQVKQQQKQGCQSGWTFCKTGCFNLKSDPNHCGKCAERCSPQQACKQGKCENNLFSGGSLLTSDHMTRLNKWAKYKTTTRWRLCFSTKLHGIRTKTFHKQCNQRGPSFTIMSINGGTRLIGGYAPVSWQKGKPGGTYFSKGNTKAFLFSLRSPKHKPYRLKLLKAEDLVAPLKNGFLDGYYTKDEQRKKKVCKKAPSISCLPNEAINRIRKAMHSRGESYGPTFGGGHDIKSAGEGVFGYGAYCYLGTTYKCPNARVRPRKGYAKYKWYRECVNTFCGKLYPKLDQLEVYVRW